MFLCRTLWLLMLAASCNWVLPAMATEPVRFSRDVLPLLSDRCFHCHGPDESHRQAELRLDQRESALLDRGGYGVIVPGDPAASELLNRVACDDENLVMPPADSHRKPLSPQEVATLKQWIAEGAPWGKHWAFENPIRPTITDAGQHPVDVLVRERLQQQGRGHAAPASKQILIRRVSFDLTGLPPSREEVDAFLADNSPDAYEKLVDRLLASPHFGERMAMWWLDAARYSDTDGFQSDATRSNWPWRDWVVDAFNSNMPFDQFTVEQFAGDLLPDSTQQQILATCFHRNHMTNGEGGRDPEESRIDYVIDRVNTTGTVWLGLTLGCAQCHTHKFDPISHQEYYSLFAYFDSIDEDGKAGDKATPYLKYQSPHAERAIAEAQAVVDARTRVTDKVRQLAEQKFDGWLTERLNEVRNGFQPWQVLTATSLTTDEGTILTQSDDGTVQASGPAPRQDDYFFTASPALSRVTGLKLDVLPHSSHTDGKLTRGPTGEFILTDVKLQLRRRGSSQVRDIDIASAIADVEMKVAKARTYGLIKDTLDDDPRNGWTTLTHDSTQPHFAIFTLADPLILEPDEELVFVMLQRSTEGDANIARFKLSATDQPNTALRTIQPMPLEELAAASVDDLSQLDKKLRKRLLEQYLADHADFQLAKSQLEQAEKQLATIKKSAGELNVMVLAERQEPRVTHILQRGVWDNKGGEVTPGVPEAILPRDSEDCKTRLDLAKWLVAEENPLTARVISNQLWQLCFGAGLVRTPEDFGLQGEFPTHPDVLDWLAVEFVESGWNVKHLLRTIVTSETYRQCSDVTPELLEWDPDNRWLARGARFRLPSWMIRDAALKSSSLLNPVLGGPPVMPYQPDGVWEEMFMGRYRYEPSQGPAQFRRTLYAFWRRSAAPTFLFDSAQRRVCEVRPQMTNTPLQALTLLNDQNLLEASRELAKAAIERSAETSARLTFLFESILSREPSPTELHLLARSLERAQQHYRESPEDASGFLNFGQPENQQTTDASDVAAYLVVASMIYNLDEAITHE